MSFTSRIREFNREYFKDRGRVQTADNGTNNAWVEYGATENFGENYDDLIELCKKSFHLSQEMRSLFFAGAIWQRDKHRAGFGEGDGLRADDEDGRVRVRDLALGVVTGCERRLYDESVEGGYYWAPIDVVRMSDGVYLRTTSWTKSSELFIEGDGVRRRDATKR